MTLSLIHRPATLDDYPALSNLQSRAMRELSAGFYDPVTMEQALAEVPLLTPNIVEEGHFHVLQSADGSIRACGGWSRQLPGYAATAGQAPAELPEDVAIVRSVYVEPRLARRGLGRRIMQIVEGDAVRHGIGTLTLTATLPGIPLYSAIGYRPTRHAEGQLSTGAKVALLEMVKFLPPIQVAA